MAKGINGGNLQQHDCVARVKRDSKLRDGLFSEPIETPDWELFTDGSSYKGKNGNRAGYAVIEWKKGKPETLKAEEIPQPASAQAAEIIAITEALKMSKDKRVNIYTDSAYGFSAVHFDGPQWLRRKFLTAAGTPVKHVKLLKDLIAAVQVPREVAVVKVAGHTKGTDKESKGNAAADKAAKQASGYEEAGQFVTLRSGKIAQEQNKGTGETTEKTSELSQTEEAEATPLSEIQLSLKLLEIVEIQEASSPQEVRDWITYGAIRQTHKQNGKVHHIWRSTGGQVVAPRTLLPVIFKETHGSTHVSVAKMYKQIRRQWWCPKLREHIENYRSECTTCNKMNTKRTLPHPLLKFPVPSAPWSEICIDYTDMGLGWRTKEGYRYLLVAVDRYSRWIEAIPTKKEDAESVVKWLTKDLIPRYGVPAKICSDNGSHFKNEHLQTVERTMGIEHRFGSVYHPESQGIVERANRTIKNKLAKALAGTQMKWTEALPLVLLSMRQETATETNLSPHEILTGRAMPGPREDPRWVDQNEPGDTELSEYMKVLGQMIDLISQQVQIGGEEEDQGCLRPLPVTVGDQVYIKVKGRPHWSEPKWTGPHKVTVVSDRSVKVDKEGDSNWHHFSHCALVKTGKNGTVSDSHDISVHD